MNFAHEPSPERMKRLQNDWAKIAGETMDVEYIKYTIPSKTRAFFSTNLNRAKA